MAPSFRRRSGGQPPARCRIRDGGFNVAPSFRRRSAAATGRRRGRCAPRFNVAPSFRRRSGPGVSASTTLGTGFNVAPSFRRRSADPRRARRVQEEQASMWLRHFDGDQTSAHRAPPPGHSRASMWLRHFDGDQLLSGMGAEVKRRRLQCGSVISTEISTCRAEFWAQYSQRLQCGSVISTEISGGSFDGHNFEFYRFNVAPSFRRRSGGDSCPTAPGAGSLQCGSVISTEISEKSTTSATSKAAASMWLRHFDGDQPWCPGARWCLRSASMWLRHFDGDQIAVVAGRR